MKRFTAYRRNLAERGTHTELQRNADDEPQFEGVIWTDGTVTLRWLTACKSTSVWNNLEDMLNIHGHPEYGTEIIWHDGVEPEEWTNRVLAWEESQPKPEVDIDILVKLHGLPERIATCLKNCGWTTLESFQDKTRAHLQWETGLNNDDVDIIVKSIRSFEGIR